MKFPYGRSANPLAKCWMRIWQPMKPDCLKRFAVVAIGFERLWWEAVE